MIYLSHFEFPCRELEYSFTMGQKRTCYDTYYPFLVLSAHQLSMLDFEPITILYGGNGSGKTTALNVIAEKLQLERDTLYNRSNFFEDYTKMCSYNNKDSYDGRKLSRKMPRGSRIITSDDVFDFMLDLRSINNGINEKREELLDDYLETKYSEFRMQSLADYEQLKKSHMAKTLTQSKFVRKNLKDNVREHSNGESAFLYFTEKIKENGLYLLDEPENSLSPEKQQELLKFLEDSARFFGCQFVIATHSPFLLSMKGAKIYDLDEDVVDVKKWTKLGNVRAYYEFFKKHESEFI
ncbi:MAG: AAA family ATPase [Lachnospiraceae bacterium]|nr:AAA family ATPase [Lachnospiraceae bacterium]